MQEGGGGRMKERLEEVEKLWKEADGREVVLKKEMEVL